MVISGTCTTEYETGSDDGLGVKGDMELEGSTAVGVICLFLQLNLWRSQGPLVVQHQLHQLWVLLQVVVLRAYQ